jgi:hypothetical protein
MSLPSKKRSRLALALVLVLASGCCVVEKAVDVAIDGTGKVMSKGIDAVASSKDDDPDAPPKKR